MPLAELIAGVRHRSNQYDPLTVASQLGLLPNAAFLDDGLKRSRDCISLYGEEIEYLLRAIPGSRLEPEGLIGGIDAMLAWVKSQDIVASDIRLAEMARESASAAHPLSGYSVSVAHLWANLFYSAAPSNSGGSSPVVVAYETLMARFNAYVIAAQSTIVPGDYFAFCADWWRDDSQPQRSIYPSRRMASRVAAASRAMRRLSLPVYDELLDYLAGWPEESSFFERVIGASERKWSDELQGPLDDIMRLMEMIVPGLQSTHGTRRRDGAMGPRRETRQKFHDGYVRVSESNCLVSSYSTDDGLTTFETFVARPKTADESSADLKAELARGISEEPDAPAALPNIEEIRNALDGQEWMPTDEVVEAGQIDAVLISASGADARKVGVSPGTRSRWAEDHRRRHLLGHKLTPSTLGVVELREVLEAMMAVPPDSENGAALACLHAAIALGRTFDSASSLEVHASHPGWDLDADRIYYDLEKSSWIIIVPPPAWRDSAITVSERKAWEQVWLRDQTGFAGLLRHFGLGPGRPVGRLSRTRRQAVLDWLGKQMPVSDNPHRDSTRFLFGRLLELSRGDVGIAGMITGTRHAHGGSVAHYSHYLGATVWHLYRQAWQSKPSKTFADNSNLNAEEPSKGYGARRVPLSDAVVTLLSELRDRVIHGRGADRHYYFTAYTWAGFVLGTGMRPVTDPHILNLAGNVGDQSVVTFVDKARTDYHRRINVLPKPLAEHLQRYAHHLRALDRDNLTNVSQSPSFRFQETDGGWRAFRPSDFGACCKPFFDLELYSLRRFVRSELIADRGLTGEDVDAFMGHWFDGVSPHDRLSTYPMMRLHGVASGAVTRLLDRVGFRPLWIDQCGR